ncbi:MAG: ammonia-forming cytochrome c nitrite reductase subunit c552 [Anaeromyxobacteraceae bacterium]
MPMPSGSARRRTLATVAAGGLTVLVLATAAGAGCASEKSTARTPPASAPQPSQASQAGRPAQAAQASQTAQAAQGGITEDTVDPAIWGKEFPLQYETYLKTVDQVRTKYGGSEALPRTPDQADPRSVVSQEKIEQDPRLKTIWSGYAFSVDFREERGHAYMLDDQTFTKRQAFAKQPGTCMNCHASVPVLYRQLGDGDATKGFEKLNAMPYAEARKHVTHPVACIDCHDPKDMSLRVTRVAFMEGMKALKASQGVKDYEVNRDAKPEEMRAFVCGQCHDEYYFRGTEKRLVFPWAKGLKPDAMVDYYDEIGFKDWVHKDTGAPVLKAQHPEFEMWNQGVHGRSGVTCADCHMPQIEYKGQSISDHQVNSPILKLKASCLPCHQKYSEAELKARVETEQDRFFGQRNKAIDAVVALIDDIKKAKAAGKPDRDLEAARYLQRRAQFLFDFVEAENSTGFHAPQEALRVLGEVLDFARQGQIAIRDPSYKPTVQVVAISTAQPGPNQATGNNPGSVSSQPKGQDDQRGKPQQQPGGASK